MSVVPSIVPISDLRQQQNEILANLPHGQIILTLRGRGVAVLVDIESWNSLLEELEYYQDALDAVLSDRDTKEATIDFVDYVRERDSNP